MYKCIPFATRGLLTFVLMWVRFVTSVELKCWCCGCIYPLCFNFGQQNVKAIQTTHCSWKSNIGGSNRIGRQFPRCGDVLRETNHVSESAEGLTVASTVMWSCSDEAVCEIDRQETILNRMCVTTTNHRLVSISTLHLLQNTKLDSTN